MLTKQARRLVLMWKTDHLSFSLENFLISIIQMQSIYGFGFIGKMLPCQANWAVMKWRQTTQGWPNEASSKWFLKELLTIVRKRLDRKRTFSTTSSLSSSSAAGPATSTPSLPRMVLNTSITHDLEKVLEHAVEKVGYKRLCLN